MLIWKDAKQSKPKQGDRVLLKIRYEETAVVGYWGLVNGRLALLTIEQGRMANTGMLIAKVILKAVK